MTRIQFTLFQTFLALLIALSTLGCGSATTKLTTSPTVAPSPSAIAKALDIPTQAPSPTATPTAEPSAFVVGNTGGDGVYIRRTTAMADRIKAWPDGTTMLSAGPDREAEGRLWQNVRDPDGTLGWVPAEYLLAVGTAGASAPAASATKIPVKALATSTAPATKAASKPTPAPSVHPPGATALCRDGTYSYSQNRRGTCSWHGGVAQWLY